ncbi:MAG: hypothetical protein J7M18_07470, partial [Candidatus Eremiobacteraeota bacterium]|nr:hypothetical protein [Candidatus Eremiobacteraeota bacterium]
RPFPGLYAMKEYRPYIGRRTGSPPAVHIQINTSKKMPMTWKKSELLFGQVNYWDFFKSENGYWLVYQDRYNRSSLFLKKGGTIHVKYQGIDLTYKHRTSPYPTPGVDISVGEKYELPDVEKVDKVAFFSPDMKKVKLWMKELPFEISHDDYYADPLERPLLDFILQVNLPVISDGYLFHASAVDDEGRGYLFPGHSGSGKSTIVNLWDGKGRIIQEDTVGVKGHRGGARVFSIPEVGARGDKGPSVYLKGIFGLKHARYNRISRLSPLEATGILFYNAMKPVWDAWLCEQYVEYCLWLASHVPCFLLEFAPEKSVCLLIRKAIDKTGKEKPAPVSPFIGKMKSKLKDFRGIPGVKL